MNLGKSLDTNRLVGKVCTQLEGLNYDEAFAPIGNRSLLCLALVWSLMTWSWDKPALTRRFCTVFWMKNFAWNNLKVLTRNLACVIIHWEQAKRVHKFLKITIKEYLWFPFQWGVLLFRVSRQLDQSEWVKEKKAFRWVGTLHIIRICPCVLEISTTKEDITKPVRSRISCNLWGLEFCIFQ